MIYFFNSLPYFYQLNEGLYLINNSHDDVFVSYLDASYFAWYSKVLSTPFGKKSDTGMMDPDT